MIQININDIANKVRSAVLTGLDVALTGAIVAGDSVLEAFGKIQNQINAINSSLGDKLEAGDDVSSLTNDAGYVDSAGAASAAPIQSVTGTAVNNTDPENPVIDSTGGGEWGSITGTLADQTDLNNVLNDKLEASDIVNLFDKTTDDTDDITEGLNKFVSQAEKDDIALNTTHRGLTNNPHSVTKTQVGLGNVSNDLQVKNADKASQSEAEAGTDDTKWMTPLKTKQAIDEFAGAAGEANTASNVGAGEGVFKEKVGVDLRFKTLVAGDNVDFDTTDADEIKIDVTGGASAAGDEGDIQFNDGADNLAADATLNFDSVNKLAKVPDLRIKESSGTNAPAANDETVLKMETEIVGADTIIRFFAQANSGEKVIIYSYIV